MVPPPEERFFVNINGLIEIIQEGVAAVRDKGHAIISPHLLTLAGTIIGQYSKKFIIETFIKKSYSHWNRIHDHDRSFFLENAMDIFAELPLGNVEAFRKLFTLRDEHGPLVGSDFEEDLWRMFESLVRISIAYIHENREMNASGEYVYEFMEFVDLSAQARQWGVTLKVSS